MKCRLMCRYTADRRARTKDHLNSATNMSVSRTFKAHPRAAFKA